MIVMIKLIEYLINELIDELINLINEINNNE